MGKGDTYRPVDKRKFDRGYLRVYGKECGICKGWGHTLTEDNSICMCTSCDGLGYVEKERKESGG